MKRAVFYHHLLAAAKQTNLSKEEIFQKASQLGYQGVECDHLDLGEDPAAFADLLHSFGLQIASVFCGLDFPKGISDAWLRNLLERIHTAGCRKLLAVPNKIPSGETEQDTQLICAGLNRLCSLATEYEIDVSVEDFDSVLSPCCSPEKLQNLFERVPELKFTLDTGNFMYLDRDILECIPALLPRITHMHLKDRSLSPILPGGSPQKSAGGTDMFDAPVGCGDIPMAQVIQIAKNQGFDGWCSAEFFSAPDMLYFLERSAQWMDQNL